MAEHVETAIIGGGQSGLAMSYWLRQLGREHLILERAGIADRWQSQRWDSLCLLTPNWTVTLPGYEYDGPDPNGFMGKDQVHQTLTTYAQRNAAPVRTGVDVTRLRRLEPAGRYMLETSVGPIEARNVVVATGPFGIKSVPPIAAQLPAGLVQIHSSEYRNPRQLPPGAVLIVGAGASAFQIAEDLLEASIPVYVSMGRHETRVRRYRGQDIAYWMAQTGQWERKLEDNPAAFFAPRASLTGAGGGHDLAVRKLAAEGATLLGRLQGVADGTLVIAEDLIETVKDGDARFQRSLRLVDDFIAREGIAAPPVAVATWPDPPELRVPILRVNLQAAGIASVIWATGFRYQFDWIEPPVIDELGNPRHVRGVTESAGLYFLGMRWLYKFKSSFIHGVNEDAEYLAEHIASRRP